MVKHSDFCFSGLCPFLQHPAINGPCTSFFSIIICRILFKQSCEEEGIQLAALNAQVIAYRDKNEDYDWLEISETYSLALQAAFGKTDWGVDDGYHRQVRMSPNVR